MIETSQDWIQAFEIDYNDALKLVYADYLEEQGEQALAEGFRWLSIEGKTPEHFRYISEGEWTWWCGNKHRDEDRCKYDLPKDVYKGLKLQEDPIGTSYKDYKTRFAALYDAARSWAEVGG